VLDRLNGLAGSLMVTALECKVLIVSSSKAGLRFQREEEVAEKAALNKQLNEERIAHARYEQEVEDIDDEATDFMELEETLERRIQKLKTQLFDQTVENQQMQLVVDKVKSNRTVVEECLGEMKKRVTKRDKLVSTVLGLYKRLQQLENDELELEGEIIAKQNAVRKVWAGVSIEQEQGEEPAAKKRKLAIENRTREHNEWLHHVLTTMTMESRINWASHEKLRDLILLDEL